VWEAHTGFDIHSHQITNVLIEVDAHVATAVSESYVTAVLWRNGADDVPAVQIIGRGRYVDRWSCRDDRWAIDHRRYVNDLQTFSTPTGAVGDGRRDRNDASYDIFKGGLW
jgi:hypothetical protein